MQGRGWRSEKVRRPRGVVRPFVEELSRELHELNPGRDLEFHVSGSWRRQAPVIGDLDIIVVTESGVLAPDLLDPGVELPRSVDWQRNGSKIANGDLRLPDGGVLHVDVWGCRPNERGAFLMFSTGPAQLNIFQRRWAARRGMALSQVGLLERGTRRQLDDGTEEDIYRLLGLDFLTPPERQRWAGR